MIKIFALTNTRRDVVCELKYRAADCAADNTSSHKGENNMDPNACFRRLMDAMADNDREEYQAAFADLATWLEKGGFAPIVSTLGTVQRNVGHGRTETVARRTLSSGTLSNGRCYGIHTVDCNSDDGPYEFVCYDWRGNSCATYRLAS